MSEMQSRGLGQKIVLDTNIFISGIFWKGDSYKILQLWRDGKIQSVISLDTLEELYRVLSKFKIHLSEDIINKHISLIRESSIIVEPEERFFIVDDPSDNKFIDCAVAGKADYIITNDKHLLKIGRFRDISILTPEKFLSYFILNA